MQISDVRKELEAHGAGACHVDAFWRNWIQRRKPSRHQPLYPKQARERIESLGRMLESVCAVREEVKSGDGSTRLVLSLNDGHVVECVVLPKDSVCISTQVGCAVGCVFCMTGKSGLLRQLTDLEIVAQVYVARRYQRIRKVVFMGMGEPSHNLPRVLSAVNFLGEYGGIGYKEIVVSTVGDRRLFEALAANRIKPALAVSLHSTFDGKRAALLPNAPKMTVSELFDEVHRYAEAGAYPIQFQWTLIAGVNDGQDEVENLLRIWNGCYAVMNMIPINLVEGSPFRRPSPERLAEIATQLKSAGILIKYRDSSAQEVDGGCGQLRSRHLGKMQSACPSQGG